MFLANHNMVPTFAEEESLLAQGCQYIAGVDEVGCGPLAGPVVAAAVILPYPLKSTWVTQVRDSKFLSAAKREELSVYIHREAVSVGIGAAPAKLIDKWGLSRARRAAMKSAVDQLTLYPDFVLIDYIRVPEILLPQKGVVNGDSLCLSIACASIVAKVARDRMMEKLDREYPGYGFAQHKGYCTRSHITCLRERGPSPVHRRSFQPVKDAVIS